MIIPVKNNLLVGQVEKEQTTSGGIILANSDVETGLKPAKVIRVGRDADSELVGYKVYIPWDKSKPVTENGQQLAIVSEDEILAIINEE
jgi:co-chaperonin GroES (HSP10)